MKIITIVGFKGGVGKTTLAVHLSEALSRKQHPTLLVDGDTNRSAILWTSKGNFKSTAITEKQLAKAVSSGQYDFMVIDSAARPSAEDLKELAEGCDIMILPTIPEMLAMDAMMQTAEALNRIGCQHHYVLLTIVPPAPSRDGEQARSALADAGYRVLKSTIRQTAAFRNATAEGKPVDQVKSKLAKTAWLDVEGVTKEILGILGVAK